MQANIPCYFCSSTSYSIQRYCLWPTLLEAGAGLPASCSKWWKSHVGRIPPTPHKAFAAAAREAAGFNVCQGSQLSPGRLSWKPSGPAIGREAESWRNAGQPILNPLEVAAWRESGDGGKKAARTSDVFSGKGKIEMAAARQETAHHAP